MSQCQGGNPVHNAVITGLENSRQVATAAAGSQTAVVAADVAFFRGALVSALANGVSPTVYLHALKSLTGGQ
jgi:hypothetical protein